MHKPPTTSSNTEIICGTSAFSLWSSQGVRSFFNKNLNPFAKVASTVTTHGTRKLDKSLNTSSALRHVDSYVVDKVSFVNEHAFHHFIALAIVTNALQMGWCVGKAESDISCFIAELVFAVIFVVEMALKLCGQRWSYFTSYWNILDFLLVWIAVVDILFSDHVSGKKFSCSECGEFGILRLLRLLRALRLFRILRAKKELAILTQGLLASLRSMFWIAVLLGVFIYAGAILCVSAFADGGQIWGEEHYFDTLFDSMLTLFNVSIMDGWSDIVRPLSKIHPIGLTFFFAYFFVASLGILNLIIGVITESTMAASAEYESSLAEIDKMERIAALNRHVDEVFMASGEDSNKITQEQFENLDSDLLEKLLVDVDVPPGLTVADLCLICSPNMEITKSELIEAMRRIIFCDQFQRDCLVQHAINDIRRRFTFVESTLEDLRHFMRVASEGFLEPGSQGTSHNFKGHANRHAESAPTPQAVQSVEELAIAPRVPHSVQIPSPMREDIARIAQVTTLCENVLCDKAMTQDSQPDLVTCWKQINVSEKGDGTLEQKAIGISFKQTDIIRHLETLIHESALTLKNPSSFMQHSCEKQWWSDPKRPQFSCSRILQPHHEPVLEAQSHSLNADFVHV